MILGCSTSINLLDCSVVIRSLIHYLNLIIESNDIHALNIKEEILKLTKIIRKITMNVFLINYCQLNLIFYEFYKITDFTETST